jgi:hypothetical protein
MTYPALRSPCKSAVENAYMRVVLQCAPPRHRKFGGTSMMSEPSIYVSFYRRQLQGEVSYSSIGSGPLTDVLTESGNAGLFLVSSLRSPPDDLWARLGTATIDPGAGGVRSRELPPLYADGAPGWFFWQGTSLTGVAARWIDAHASDLPGPSEPLWLELNAWRVTGLVPHQRIRLQLESAWVDTWPAGPVFVRFDGASAGLLQVICAREAAPAN